MTDKQVFVILLLISVNGMLQIFILWGLKFWLLWVYVGLVVVMACAVKREKE